MVFPAKMKVLTNSHTDGHTTLSRDVTQVFIKFMWLFGFPYSTVVMINMAINVKRSFISEKYSP
jgi:hypothetical protein